MDFLRITRLVAILATAAFVVSCGGDSGSSTPADAPDALGSHAVGHTMFTAVDAARDDRALIVNVWYPVDDADAKTEPLTEYPL